MTEMDSFTTTFAACAFGVAPNNPNLPKLPSCSAVGFLNIGKALGNAFGPITDAAGAIKQVAEEGLNAVSSHYATRAAVYSATDTSTRGTIGLIVPLRSSIYRGLLATSTNFARASAATTGLLIDYYLIKQNIEEVQNPTPCQ